MDSIYAKMEPLKMYQQYLQIETNDRYGKYTFNGFEFE